MCIALVYPLVRKRILNLLFAPRRKKIVDSLLKFRLKPLFYDIVLFILSKLIHTQQNRWSQISIL